ncbi:LysR family transcriptional regulator, glycine cleavage system transcriptional activator [Pseudomonas sp. IT-196MI5]|uniref:LysR family transcriptional regulator n=1 Tax=Pseudomonas sp. IT-196MI5 TaxID=3026440 RepID=UPI0039E0E053
MRKLPPLNSVRAFESAARHQSFTAAAAELCVTVTAVSHQVRQLESCIGHKLFERTGRNVELTPVGRTIYPFLRDGFDQIAHAFSIISAPKDGDAIQLSTTRAFAERWLMPRLARFNQLYPNIVVHIHGSEKAVDLRCESIDLAIRYGPVEDCDRGSVILEDFYIAVADQSLCPADRCATIDDFRNRPLLAYKWKNQDLEAPAWSAWLARVNYRQGTDFRISWYSEETLALHAAERGLGPLLCSDVLIEDEIRSGRMRQIEGPRMPGFAYRLVEVSSPGRKQSLAIFIDWLRQEADLCRGMPALSVVK